MAKVYGSVTVRRRARDGADGQDAVYATCSPSVVTVDCDSAGKPLAAASARRLAVVLHHGDSVASDMAVGSINGSSAASVTLNGITLTKDGGNLFYSYGTSSSVASSDFTVMLRSASVGQSASVTVSFVCARQGAQGIQGLRGQLLRNRGMFSRSSLESTGETLYNTAGTDGENGWCDYIRYKADGETVYRKYRLDNGVTEWTKDCYVKDGITYDTATARVPAITGTATHDGVWAVFDSLNDVSAGFLIAESIDSGSASTANAFIGDSSDGVGMNGDGSISVGSTANGWAVNGGRIRHTRTGVELTADGRIVDPDGLSLMVGDKAVAKTANLLPWAGFPTAPFAGGGCVDYVTAFNSLSPYGSRILRVQNTGSSAVSYLGLTSATRVRLRAGRTYTLTLWAALGTSLGAVPLYFSANLYDTETGGSGTSYSDSTQQLAPVSGVQRLSFTFSTGSRCYLETELMLPTLAAGRAVGFLGAMLTLGNGVPSAWEPWSVQGEAEDGLAEELLATGIDIGHRRMVFTADNFLVQNNEGSRTAYMDAIGNLCIRGVYGRMVTEVDGTNWDTYFAANGGGDYDLDILRSEGMVILTGLPSGVSAPVIRLPFAAQDYWGYAGATGSRLGLAARQTKVIDPDGVNGVRYITGDELRMSIGRRIILVNRTGADVLLYCGPIYHRDTDNTWTHPGNSATSENGGFQIQDEESLSLELCYGQLKHGTTYEYCYFWVTQMQACPFDQNADDVVSGWD